MDSKISQHKYKELSDLLNEWNPIGVREADIKDEYECFMGPHIGVTAKGCRQK